MVDPAEEWTNVEPPVRNSPANDMVENDLKVEMTPSR